MRTTKTGMGWLAAVADRLFTGTKQLAWALGLLLTAAGLSQAWAGVSVTLTAPANGASFTTPANVTLSATASATQGYSVQKVEFFHSGTVLIGTDTTSPYSFTWSSVPAGSYTITAVATAVKKNSLNQTATSAPVSITVNTANAPPTVSMTSPANGASFTALANITLAASAADSDGTIQKVEFFHGGTNLIATVTSPPYSITWTEVPQGAYALTARATDNLNATTTSSPVNITVGAPAAAQLYFIHTDHLNTPRLITNNAGQAVWRWDNIDPFGGNPPDENPSGLGVFSCNLRLPGQYFDQETNLHYNYFRDYDPAIGRYIQSDPIGLAGGVNTYAYVRNNPLRWIDPFGLDVTMTCRPVAAFGAVGMSSPVHCAVIVWHYDECGRKVIDAQYTVPGAGTSPTRKPTDPTYAADRRAFGSGPGNYPIPAPPGMSQGDWDRAVMNSGNNYSQGPYFPVPGPNSNTAAGNIITNAGGTVPSVPGALGLGYQPVTGGLNIIAP